MPKRKTSDCSTDDTDENVPIPIQFFFWNQSSLFIKHKFSNLTEAHAMNFERVLVQNILHGLSPGLSDAINSISRWAFIKASFPHIMHACAAALVVRKDNKTDTKLNKTETKLLYTLHWLILDAASECEDNAAASKISAKSASTSTKKNSTNSATNSSSVKPKSNHYLHSVATIQLFVYLFVPILKSLKPDDLDNLKLSNGLKVWEPLWAYRQPDIPIFNSPVKQKPSHVDSSVDAGSKASLAKQESEKRSAEAKLNESMKKASQTTPSKQMSNFGNIYMGSNKSERKAECMSKTASILNNLKRNTSQSEEETKKEGEKKKLSRESSMDSSLDNLKTASTNANQNNIEIVIRESEKDEESSSFQISEFESDTIRDSLLTLNKKSVNETSEIK